MSALTIDTLITTLRGASDAQFLTFMQLLNDRGIPLFHAAEPVIPTVPVASDYRVCAADIDETVCIGRSLKGGEDKRWKPIIYRESQCGKKTVDGADLCTICTKRAEKYDAKPGAWVGRVTEEPYDWVHMLGTEWATIKKPVFDASASASVADSDSDSESKAAAAEKAAAKAEKAAAAAAEKAAAKAEKAAAAAAEKAAAKAAKAATAAAEKAAAKTIKEAATAAKKGVKAATKSKEE